MGLEEKSNYVCLSKCWRS